MDGIVNDWATNARKQQSTIASKYMRNVGNGNVPPSGFQLLAAQRYAVSRKLIPFRDSLRDVAGVHTYREYVPQDRRHNELALLTQYLTDTSTKGCDQRVVVVFGPDGSGRHALVRTACQNFQVVEWDECESLTTQKGVSALRELLIRLPKGDEDPIAVVITDAVLRMETPDTCSSGDVVAMVKGIARHNPLIIIADDLRGAPNAMFNRISAHRYARDHGSVVKFNGRSLRIKLRSLRYDIIQSIIGRVVSRVLPRTLGKLPAAHSSWWSRAAAFCGGNGHVAVRRALSFARGETIKSEDSTTRDVDLFEMCGAVFAATPESLVVASIPRACGPHMDGSRALASSAVKMLHQNLEAGVGDRTDSMAKLSGMYDTMSDAACMSRYLGGPPASGVRRETADLISTWGMSVPRLARTGRCRLKHFNTWQTRPAEGESPPWHLIQHPNHKLPVESYPTLHNVQTADRCLWKTRPLSSRALDLSLLISAVAKSSGLTSRPRASTPGAKDAHAAAGRKLARWADGARIGHECLQSFLQSNTLM